MYGISNGQQKGNGGGGSANYTKIESTIPTTAWVSSAPSWIGQNALAWSVHQGAYYTQGGTEDLGLSAGGSYSAVLTIDGTDYDAENFEIMDESGSVIYLAYFNNSAVMLEIIDHCNGLDEEMSPIPGNGYLVMVMLMGGTVPSSVIVKSFSGAGGISAIISNSAIKVNSAVTMYIDYNGKIKAAGKADGSLTLSASATPTVEIPYAIEITDTNTEGLFEIINDYLPTVPEIPTSLPQTTSGYISVGIQTTDWTQNGEYYYYDFTIEGLITDYTDVLFRVNYQYYIEISEKMRSGSISTIRVTVKKLPTKTLYIYYRVGQTSGGSSLGDNITVVNEFSGYITDKPDHLYLTDTATGTLYEVTIANGTISLVAKSST